MSARSLGLVLAGFRCTAASEESVWTAARRLNRGDHRLDEREFLVPPLQFASAEPASAPTDHLLPTDEEYRTLTKYRAAIEERWDAFSGRAA